MAYQPLTPDQFKKAREAGFTQEQIIDMEKKRKAASATLPAVTPEPAPAPTPSRASQIGTGAKNALGGFLYGFSAPGRTIQNLASKAVDKVAGTAGFGAATKEGFERSSLADLDTTAAKVGNVAGETAFYLAAPGGLIKGGATKTLPFLPRVGGRIATNLAIGTAQTGDIKKGLTTAALSEALTAAAKPIGLLGKGVYKGLAIPTSAKEAAKIQAFKASNSLPKRIIGTVSGQLKAPITADETAFSKNLFGTESMIGVQAQRAKKQVWNGIVAPALKQNTTKIDLTTFFDDAQREIVKATPELSRQKSLLNALNAMRDDYRGQGPISLEQLQNLKSGWTEFIPEKAYKGENIAGSFKQVQKIVSDAARKKIQETIADPAVKRAYIDYGNLDSLAQWGQKAMTGGKFKGGTGGFITALKDAVLTPIATVGGLVTYKTASGLTFIAAPGAKVLADIFSEDFPKEQSPEQ